MISLTAEVRALLTPPPGGTLLIATVGNELRADDGAGPAVARRALHPRSGIVIRDAGEHPEYILQAVETFSPTAVVIIDAADFGGSPGEARRLDEKNICHKLLTTHIFPLVALVKIVRHDTGVPVSILGIQAGSTALGDGLSPEVEATVDMISSCIAGQD